MKQKKTTVLSAAAMVLPLAMFNMQPISARAQEPVRNTDTVKVLNEVLINDSRVGERSPFTTSNLDRKQLDETKTELSIPFMLELQPSVVVSGENGKLGETSMRIRGVDATRINVNINGITLNDPESQSVFWYNVPNLGGMAQSIQIQRGVGASNGGSSFGGAINLQTLNAKSQPYGQAGISYGSWNTRQYDIAAGTGITGSGFALDVAYNGQTTEGFVRNGWADQQSLFLSGSYYGERSLLKAVAIIGRQHTGITWNGEYASSLDLDPRYNSAGEYQDAAGNVLYYGNECDFYNQRRYQLYWSFLLDDRWSLKAVADFTHGDGYYEQYKADKAFQKYGMNVFDTAFTFDTVVSPDALDTVVVVDTAATAASSDFVVRKQMLNSAFTANISANYNGDRLKVAFGEMFLYYDGNHFGNVIWAKDSAGFDANHHEWYRNKGVKVDATTYAKLDYEFSPRWNVYADLQLRLIDYKVFGLADDLFDMDFHEFYPFFNPKVGVNYRMDDRQRLYLVAGLSHREPTRSDIKDAIGNADTIKAETMLDIELGYNYTASRFAFGINGYAMLYKDQLTPSGDLSSSGYSLMENVDKSYRLGVELVGGYRFTDWLRFDANLTLSMNKIVDYTYTDFADGDTLLTTYTANTDLSFSPNVVGAAIATFEPIKDLKLQLSGKYVGSQYLDNTSREVYKQEAYFLLNFKAGYTWHLKNHNEVEAQFVVNNLLNRMYRIGAWAGDYEWGGYYHSCGWYQQPGINCLGRLAVRF